MKQVEFIEQFLSKSDKEIVKFSKEYGIDLTLEEVQRLRPLSERASITWLFTGIPNSFLKEVESIIGKKKLKKLLKYLDSH
ncbi:endonuclease IV [Lysinibacillus sp. SGAir0095]|uniref:endonuclease IV n=1 Tax=Lysinibacillus sp. SGAir0095 TaxID=2070463 RepID=UPI0010CCFB5B|nr:endonuclease IV [Lysinibacillus sp. SGAir0095]QCR32900.1 endonuclease IV [Lysinibacillus sp. SGAir0095]